VRYFASLLVRYENAVALHCIRLNLRRKMRCDTAYLQHWSCTDSITLLCVIRYKKLEALAQKILAKDPNATEVLDKLKQLKAEQDQMEEMWEKKNKELTDAKDLQVGRVP